MLWERLERPDGRLGAAGHGPVLECQAERWVLQAVEERAPSKGWARTASLAADAAFHAYSRGAQDYEP